MSETQRETERGLPFQDREDAASFARRFHFGVQGITATRAGTQEVIGQLLSTGRQIRAFDTELSMVEDVRDMLPEGYPMHVPISYPMGNTSTKIKLRDIGEAVDKGIRDLCVALDMRAALSGRWADLTADVQAIEDQYASAFAGKGGYLAHIIPGDLLSESDLIRACAAVQKAGGQVIKINPGAGLSVSSQQIAAIYREFGHDTFDVHPSGGIRDLASAMTYLRMGCTTIHTRAALAIIRDYALGLAKESDNGR